jgi:hypothetical protein
LASRCSCRRSCSPGFGWRALGPAVRASCRPGSTLRPRSKPPSAGPGVGRGLRLWRRALLPCWQCDEGGPDHGSARRSRGPYHRGVSQTPFGRAPAPRRRKHRRDFGPCFRGCAGQAPNHRGDSAEQHKGARAGTARGFGVSEAGRADRAAIGARATRSGEDIGRCRGATPARSRGDVAGEATVGASVFPGKVPVVPLVPMCSAVGPGEGLSPRARPGHIGGPRVRLPAKAGWNATRTTPGMSPPQVSAVGKGDGSFRREPAELRRGSRSASRSKPAGTSPGTTPGTSPPQVSGWNGIRADIHGGARHEWREASDLLAAQPRGRAGARRSFGGRPPKSAYTATRAASTRPRFCLIGAEAA